MDLWWLPELGGHPWGSRARMRCVVTRKGGEGMDVLLVCDTGVERHEIEELPQLLERRDAVVWVDIPSPSLISLAGSVTTMRS